MSPRPPPTPQIVVSEEGTRPWRSLIAGIVIGGALTLLTLRALQEMSDVPPPNAA